MKKIFLFIILFFFTISLVSAYSNEIDKIRWHLLRTENVLRKVDTRNLTDSQVKNRLINLNYLHQYALEGKYPNNDIDLTKTIPIFKGSNGNLCAVGYLMNKDKKYQNYVENIVNNNNLIYVMDIKDGVFDKWLNENGFTQLEAAMIQPTYEGCNWSQNRNNLECKIKFYTNIVGSFIGLFILLVIFYLIIKLIINSIRIFYFKNKLNSNIELLTIKNKKYFKILLILVIVFLVLLIII